MPGLLESVIMFVELPNLRGTNMFPDLCRCHLLFLMHKHMMID